jgi:DMSO/TMAO reductase YedYZ molybdopterin-dependent catalytic subunit
MTMPSPPAAGPSAARAGAQPTGLAMAAGTVAGLVTVAASDLTAWLLAPDAAPLSVFAASLARLLPTNPADSRTDVTDVAANPLTLVMTGLLMLLVCALAGVLEFRRRYAGVVVFAAIAAAGVGAKFVIVPSWFQTFLPSVVGPAAGYLVLHLLITRLTRHLAVTAELSRVPDQPRAESAEGGPPAQPVDLTGPVTLQRRAFLKTMAIAASVAAAAVALGEGLLSASRQAAATRSQIRLPAPAQPPQPVPAGADLRIKGLTPYVTPNVDFYRIDTALQVPNIDPELWRLTVTGLVEQELSLSYADLLARPLVEHLSTLTCKANPIGANPIAGNLVGNAAWLGYPVRELLAQARPKAEADMVLSVSVDGWSAGTPLSALQSNERQALLAVGMNGQILPPEHGFPVRMIVPGLYGDVSATKWVTELKVTTFTADEGYWTPLGWSVGGAIKLSSRIDVPRPTTISPGPVTVAGVAYAPHIGISAVEVRVDDDDWREAELAEVTGPDTWRQWEFRWVASPGQHRLTVRATDADGNVQTDEINPPAPSGATGLHTIAVRVREA